MAGNVDNLFEFMIRFFACIYSDHIACSFNVTELSAALSDLSIDELLDVIRERTWHKTIYSNNTSPSVAAIELHTKQFNYILSSFAHATISFHNLPDPKQSGWNEVVVNGVRIPCP